MNRPYHHPHPWNWFLKRPAYVRFMLRELTAVAIGGYLVFLLVLLAHLRDSEQGLAQWLVSLRSGPSIVLHVLALAAALFHSITWFNLTPKAIPMFLGEKRVAAPLVAMGMGYLPWLLISILILWGLGR